MTDNKITEITLCFGEDTCPTCGGSGEIVRNGYECYRCGHCQGKGNIPLSVTFDLWEECPVCHGNKIIPNKTPYRNMIDCPNCNEVYGKVPRYWTPEEAAEKIKEETGVDWEWQEYTPCWVKPLFGAVWVLEKLGRIGEPYLPVIAFPGQPAPSPDYRPKEKE